MRAVLIALIFIASAGINALSPQPLLATPPSARGASQIVLNKKVEKDSNKNPETVIEIGLDFFGGVSEKKSNRKGKLPQPGLPADYWKKVALAIENNRTQLKECSGFLAKNNGNEKQRIQPIFSIQISSEGRGKIDLKTLPASNQKMTQNDQEGDLNKLSEMDDEQNSENTENAEKCLQSVLMEVQYPPHPLEGKWVKFDLPIELEREIL